MQKILSRVDFGSKIRLFPMPEYGKFVQKGIILCMRAW